MPQMDDRLKVLFDYTKFHIGVYLTLSGILFAVLVHDGKFVDPILTKHLFATFVFFVLAGLCGGIVASNIPEHISYDKFKDEPLPLYDWLGGFMRFKARVWIRCEHLFFWIGIGVAIWGLFRVAPRLMT